MNLKRLGINTRLIWKRAIRIPRELGLWAAEAWPLWLALSVPLVVLISLGAIPLTPEAQIKCSGVVLQILGLVVIAFGLNALRKELRDDQQGFGAALALSLKRLALIFLPTQSKSVELEMASQEKSHDGVELAAFTTLKGRLDILEREMKATRQKIAAVESHNEIRIRELLQRTEESQASLKERITSAHLRGLAPELVAVGWIILGTIMAATPSQIAVMLEMG